MSRRILFPLIALVVAAGVWWLSTGDAPEDGAHAAAVMTLCERIPTPEEVETEMVSLGWTPLPAGREEELAETTALFHIASRRATEAEFDVAAERAQLDARMTDAMDSLEQPGLRAFGRPDAPDMAVLAPVIGIPVSIGCDLYLPAGAGRGWWDAMTDGHAIGSDENGWATTGYTKGQLARPGLWVANIVILDPDSDELTEFLGQPPNLTVLSRNAFRGETAE